MNDITYFAQTNFRNRCLRFGFKQADRLYHSYLVGKTGTGKTNLMLTLIMDDINSGRGLCFIDPHGDAIVRVMSKIPEHRKRDVIYFDMTDPMLKLKYNPLKRVHFEKRSLVASGVIEVFKKLYSDAWGHKLEHLLRMAVLTLLDQTRATIEDIPRILLDRDYRKAAIAKVQNASISDFWRKEFVHYNVYDFLPVLNKMGGMLAHPAIKRVLIENPDEVYLRKAMDERAIVLVNISKGHLGEDASHILGGMFFSSLNSAAFSRASQLEEERVPFIVYADEFHTYVCDSVINMLSELRKFRVGLVLANQYMYQLDEDVRRAVFGNVGTLISFRVGMDDARHLANEMYPVFNADDFIGLPNYSVYLKLMVDGCPSRPFSAETIAN